MNIRSITIHGIRHRFFFWGHPRKPKLFLFHGWLDTAASFEFICRDLQKDFYCVAPDFRGYGKSQHSKSPLGYFIYEYVADVHAMLELFSPKKPARVLGHSLGGGVLGFYAGAFPEKISHFVNIEGFAFRHSPSSYAPEKLRSWIEGLGRQRFRHFASFEKFAERLRKANPRLSPQRALFLARHLGRKTPQGVLMAADPNHKLLDPHLLPKELFYAFWEKITARCLLVSAEESEVNRWVQSDSLKQEMQERLSHFPKNRQEVVVKNSGHMLHHEQPEALAKIVSEFLKGM